MVADESVVDWAKLHGEFFNRRRVLVTGGAGFIGSHLVDALARLNARIVVVDDLSAGHRENVPTAAEFIRASILDRAALDAAMRGCEIVFHEAALGAVARSVADPALYHDVNTTGTSHVLEAARHAGVRRVLFAASSSAYGDSESLPKIETMAVQPLSPYAATKVAGEAMMRAYGNCYALDTASLRYFNVFGPRQSPDSAYAAVIAAFASAFHRNATPVVYGDGEQSRDFTYVANVVHANLLAARAEKRLTGEVMNVGVARQTSINTLAREMATAFGQSSPVIDYEPARVGDVKHSLADISKTQAFIGYEPIVTFEAGLRATTAWYRQTLANR